MSRIPPNLLYLTIYNPTLKPARPVPKDDEDAEEQAHIIFYTSKDRATSRDKMLRQVGLAKALVNFSACVASDFVAIAYSFDTIFSVLLAAYSAFNASEPCDNVHSQTKRMLMLSPEPDFWIHAAIELARVPKPARGKDSKDKAKAAPTYEYDESSVNDVAVRAAMLAAYERFKLTHGSFASILANLGQEALELQLERFFTVWAWSWEFGDGIELADTLAPALHPLHRSLLPILDEFLQDIQEPASVLLISPPYVVPSSSYRYPASLSRHLLTLAPVSRPANTPSTLSETTIREKPPDDGTINLEKDKQDRGPAAGGEHGFMGLPQFSMPKLNWGGYLTFGKKKGDGERRKTSAEVTKDTATEEEIAKVKGASESAQEDSQKGDNAQTADERQERESEAESSEADSTAPDAGSTAPDAISVTIESEDSVAQPYTDANVPQPGTDVGVSQLIRADSVPQLSLAEAKVDLSALDDAMSSISVPPPSVAASDAPSAIASDAPPPISTPEAGLATTEGGLAVEGEITRPTSRAEGELLAVERDLQEHDARNIKAQDSLPPPEDDFPSPEDSPPSPTLEVHKEPPEHTVTTVHLEGADGQTRRRKVALYMRSGLTLAYIPDGFDDDIARARDDSPSSGVTDKMPALFDALETATTAEELGGSLESLPSTSRILQPKDQHIISTENFSIASSGFSSRSEHLYNIQQLLDGYVVILRLFPTLFLSFVALIPTFVSYTFSSRTYVLTLLPSDPEIREVFSRGQNPQYWHVGRRGLGNDRKEDIAGDIFMEVFRKEASLADVDNAVVASIRKSGLE
ncbi:uncharacterized protein SCHCODRAFT_02665679 [Schizophyllum commune H4-8]|nr:uncharacterized protein SCHCODRAFT_02665679 [Schizophyllum commune H4-8]KAI5895317.1 hypothetical protein SCHCODRAFT_02665679 [Schizophyllum commune H4-8]